MFKLNQIFVAIKNRIILYLQAKKQTVRMKSDDSISEPFGKLPKKENDPLVRNCMIALFFILFACIVFVLTSSPIRVVTTPLPDNMFVKGFPPPIAIFDRYLALPGKYSIVAQKKGYKNLKKSITVKLGSNLSFEYDFQKLPGLLDIMSGSVNGAEVLIDGEKVGDTPLTSLEVEAGRHELTIMTERYLNNVKVIEVQGMGVRQSIDVVLEPGWGTVNIQSVPEGSDVYLDGISVGQTPLTTNPMRGEYTLELSLDGWQTTHADVKIEPGQVITLPPFEMQKVDGKLELTSMPTGARVMINDEFRGVTPITIPIPSETTHTLSLSKSGFKTMSQTVQVGRDEVRKLNLQLETEYGIVFIVSDPADAILKVDGNVMEGFASRRLSLATFPHQIEISRDGYEPYCVTVTPTLGISKTINVKLKTNREVLQEKVYSNIKTTEGQILRKIMITDPVQIQLGASRREAGRRSNEALYMVELSRSFAISIREVTNAEFRRFRKEHDSGSYQGIDLNGDKQPVVLVTWNDAISYLNWLSEKDGLTPAYEENEGKMIAVVPMTTGYRLPTESEWAFMARYEGGIIKNKKPLKFPWGYEFKPPNKSGNYADSSAEGNLPIVINNYIDGHKVASPVGTYSPNNIGLFDLGGNVSEWCHDYYDIHVHGKEKMLRDPMGPDTGQYHVVRGSSWRHGSITELRLSYRDYAEESRNDLGFRIVRYIESE
jgi:formylglycine-generating enzyme required for sulfatase activity